MSSPLKTMLYRLRPWLGEDRETRADRVHAVEQTDRAVKDLMLDIIGPNHKLGANTPDWKRNENDLKDHLRRKVEKL